MEAVDPCLYMKRSANSIVYIALYADHNLLIRSPQLIDEAVEQLKKMGKLTESLCDLLSFGI